MSTATWKRLINHSDLQRSSHVVSVTSKHVYVFGGELVPREPRDDKIFDVDLNSAGTAQALCSCCMTDQFEKKAMSKSYRCRPHQAPESVRHRPLSAAKFTSSQAEAGQPWLL